MHQVTATPPREVKIAAIVAIVGGSLFALVGLGVAGTVGFMVLSIANQYHVSVRNAGSDFREIMGMFAYLAGVPLVLGLAGIFTGRGLLQLRPWARFSAIAWAIVSTVTCFYLLAHPAFKSGFQPSATAITLLMLFLFPVNAWWLFLFFRASTRELFEPSPVSAYRRDVSSLMKRDRVARYVILTVATVAVLGIGYRIQQRSSAMKEIARSRDALSTIKSWHFHTVRYISGLAPETIDKDTVCPSFQHVTSTYRDAAGLVQTREGIYYFGSSYYFADGRWQPAQRRAEFVDPGIFECNNGATNGDENSISMAGVLEDGNVKRGELISVDGDSCREYAVSVPTPHDPQEKEFQFTICINEQDHLPRETRRTAPGATHEGVSRFSQWNAMSEPQLPPEFPK